jgi:Tol biopolymer transport system component
MSDLRERLRALDRLDPPDLRPRLGMHAVPPPPDRSSSRLAALVLALVVGLVGISVAYLAFARKAPSLGPVYRPLLHPNGAIWFLGGDQPGSVFGRSGVFWVNAAGGRPHAVPTSKRLYSLTALAVSPDGRLIAVSSGGGEFPPRNIYVMQPDGSHLQQITSGSVWDTSPAWSPDGSSIVFTSNRCCTTANSSGNYALYTMDPDGSELRRITYDTASDVSPAWSPDGTRIAYIRSGDEGRLPQSGQPYQIWTVNADGTDARALTNNGRMNDAVAWSPDGRDLAYISHLSNDADWQIRVMRADGSGDHKVFSCAGKCRYGGYTLAWSPDGQEIAFTVTVGTGTAVIVKPQIVLIDAAGGGFRVVDTRGVEACCPSWIGRSGP